MKLNEPEVTSARPLVEFEKRALEGRISELTGYKSWPVITLTLRCWEVLW